MRRPLIKLLRLRQCLAWLPARTIPGLRQRTLSALAPLVIAQHRFSSRGCSSPESFSEYSAVADTHQMRYVRFSIAFTIVN